MLILVMSIRVSRGKVPNREAMDKLRFAIDQGSRQVTGGGQPRKIRGGMAPASWASRSKLHLSGLGQERIGNDA
jgi:hypothetical protein